MVNFLFLFLCNNYCLIYVIRAEYFFGPRVTAKNLFSKNKLSLCVLGPLILCLHV